VKFLKGFTLIELLVILAIIGAMIALLIPSISAARRAAEKADRPKIVAASGFKEGSDVRIKLNNKRGVVQESYEHNGKAFYKVSYVDDRGQIGVADLMYVQIETWRN
jgi:Tfp pilus assembly protein PilE